MLSAENTSGDSAMWIELYLEAALNFSKASGVQKKCRMLSHWLSIWVLTEGPSAVTLKATDTMMEV